jgi:hypothetical protein
VQFDPQVHLSDSFIDPVISRLLTAEEVHLTDKIGNTALHVFVSFGAVQQVVRGDTEKDGCNFSQTVGGSD